MHTGKPHPPETFDHPAPKKYVLVVSCMDARLLDNLVHFLELDNLTNRYYHTTFAGAALAVSPKDVPLKPNLPQPPDFKQWRGAFVDQMRATIVLTKGELRDVYIVQHEDCGAFKLLVDGFEELSPAKQREVNEEFADALVDDIKKHFCTEYNPMIGVRDCRVQQKPPTVRSFFMDLRGHVTKFGHSYEPKAGKCKNYCPCTHWGNGEGDE